MRVMVFGTYDVLHKGHLYFLNQAKKLGDYLVVVIARNVTVKRIKNITSHHDETQRMQAVEKTGIADKVILGDDPASFQCIINEKPDIICLGYDQDSRKVEKEFPKIKYVRIDAYHPHIYKSSKIRPP